jgi:hypothetical protein
MERTRGKFLNCKSVLALFGNVYMRFLCLPRADGTNDTEGSVTGGEDLLIVLNALLGKGEGGEVLEEGGDHVDFHGGELALQQVSTCTLYLQESQWPL